MIQLSTKLLLWVGASAAGLAAAVLVVAVEIGTTGAHVHLLR